MIFWTFCGSSHAEITTETSWDEWCKRFGWHSGVWASYSAQNGQFVEPAGCCFMIANSLCAAMYTSTHARTYARTDGLMHVLMHTHMHALMNVRTEICALTRTLVPEGARTHARMHTYMR